MFKKKLNDLLLFLTNTINKYDFADDEQKIKYFYDELQKLEIELPSIEKLDKLKKIEIDLEVKYEFFNELNIYFDPIYIEIKNQIHKEKVDKLRNENKRKRAIS